MTSLNSTNSEQGIHEPEGREPELAPQNRVAVDRQQAKNPEAVPFEADHRIDEPRRKRREDQPHDGQVQKADHVDPGDVADVAVRVVEAIDVQKIQTQEAEKDQKLRPLHRIAAQAAASL